MERFTRKLPDGRNILPQDRIEDVHKIENGKALRFMVGEPIDKLADFEDAEDRGLLIHLPCEAVYHIVDQNTRYGPMVMKKRIRDLNICEIEGIDKDGKYWSTRQKAEQKMKKSLGD